MSAIATCVLLGAALGSILTIAVIAIASTIRRAPMDDPVEWQEDHHRQEPKLQAVATITTGKREIKICP